MLYNTKLNEFTLEQLKFLQGAVSAQAQEINYSLSAIDFWETSEIKTDMEAQLKVDFDNAILWKVQIENAISDIKEINKVNSN
jgi:hypothetical protein